MTERTETASTWRRAASVLLVTVAPAVTIITADRWRAELPDPLPTHWSGRLPDGFTSYGAFSTTLITITAVAAASAAAGAFVIRTAPIYRRLVVTTAGAVAWFALGLWLSIVAAAWDSADASTVEISWWPLLAISMLAGGAAASWLTYGRTPAPPRRDLVDTEMVVASIRAGERAVWTRRTAAPIFYGVAGLTLFLSLVPWLVGAAPVVGAVAVIAAAAVAALGSIRVTVDHRGLTVQQGVVGLLRKTIPLESVEQAAAATIRPMEWGGWGYRVLPGRSAVVLRAGPGIVVDLENGRQFAVTVGDAETGAAVLNALVLRGQGAPGPTAVDR